MRLPVPVLLAVLTVTVGAPLDSAAAPKKKATAAEKEAEAFLDTITALLMPVSAVAAEADWAAATDVTPEHTGLRTGADKALATLSGSTVIITRTKALLAKKKDLDDVTVRQLEKLP